MSVLVSTALAQSELFPSTEFDCTHTPQSIATGDLNADGRPDIVIGGPMVEVFLNLGGGEFALPRVTDVGGTLPVLIDVNADGFLDVVAVPAFVGGSTLVTLLGNGQGALTPTGLAATPFVVNVTGLAVADLNGDALPDAAGVNNTPNMALLANTGGATFGAVTLVPLAGNARGVVAEDVTGDGKRDLVALLTSPIRVQTVVNLGGGSFQAVPPVSLPTLTGTPTFVVAKVDGDATPDSIVASTGGGLVVAFSDGLGGWLSPISNTAIVATGMAVSDLDGDARLDAMLVSSSPPPIQQPSALLGDGLGHFVPSLTTIPPVATSAVGVALRDLTGDGKTDLAVLNRAAAATFGRLVVTRGDGSGAFPIGKTFAGPASGAPDMGIVELNQDGNPDVLVSNGTNAVSILLGDGLGNLGAPAIQFVGATPVRVRGVDVTGDGKPDIVTANQASSNLSVLAASGAGTFAAGKTYPTGILSPTSLSLADVDTNGSLDVVVSSSVQGTSSGSAGFVCVMRNDGAGAFPTAANYMAVVPDPTLGAIAGSLAADVTGDGKSDVVFSYTTKQTMSGTDTFGGLFVGNGAGGFAPVVPSSVAPLPSSVGTTRLTPGDVNSDGKLDILSIPASSNPKSALLSLGLGGGQFAATQTYVTGQGVWIGLADLDVDGKPDIVASGGSPGVTTNAAFGAFFGDGQGGFGPIRGYTNPGAIAPTSGAIGDLNADGRVDVAVTGFAGGVPGLKVGVLLNCAAEQPGTTEYGVGTAGCAGLLGIASTMKPKVGSADFTLIATNAPPSATGFGILGSTQDVGGSDFFGIGILLHVLPLGGPFIVVPQFKSDLAGYGRWPIAIPSVPSLIGQTFYAQSAWFWPTCTLTPLHLSSSRGLAVTIRAP